MPNDHIQREPPDIPDLQRSLDALETGLSELEERVDDLAREVDRLLSRAAARLLLKGTFVFPTLWLLTGLLLWLAARG